MAFCSKCGAQIDEATKTCSACGTKPGGFDFNDFLNTPDSSAQFAPQDIESNKVMAILSYLGFLALIPYLTATNSPYARYHAVQGMYLFVAELALCLATGILYAVMWWVFIIPSLVSSIVGLVCIAYIVIGIIYAATGKARELPGMSEVKKLGWFK